MFARVKDDYRSNTGQNLRKLMKIAELTNDDAPPEDIWKINLAKEIIDVKPGLKDLDILPIDQMEEILANA